MSLLRQRRWPRARRLVAIRGHVTGACALTAIALASPGCVSKVTMAEAQGDDGERPHTVILYSGVRDTSRQYADYSVVDASILEDR